MANLTALQLQAVFLALHFTHELQVIIYSGDSLTGQQLLESASSNFDITVTSKFKVLEHVWLVQASTGSYSKHHHAMIAAHEALFICMQLA